METTQVVVIGAGPIGIEVAALLKGHGVPYLHFEKGQIGDTMHRRWPPGSRFFSSPERVAIAGIPIQTVTQEMMPREHYLAYLRSVVEILDLEIATYHRVSAIERLVTGFHVTVRSSAGISRVSCRQIVFATGDMDHPTRLGIRGEDLPHVHHVMKEPHEYFGKRVVIIGGKNSAVENAIRCFRSGARVTLAVRSETLVLEKLNSRLGLEIRILTEKEKIGLMTGAEASEISETAVTFSLRGTGKSESLPADFVIINAGYQADLSLMKDAGVTLSGAEERPTFDPQTMETDVPGVYLAGTASGGNSESYKIFVGTCHGHAPAILKDITGIAADNAGTIAKRRYPFSVEDIEPKES